MDSLSQLVLGVAVAAVVTPAGQRRAGLRLGKESVSTGSHRFSGSGRLFDINYPDFADRVVEPIGKDKIIDQEMLKRPAVLIWHGVITSHQRVVRELSDQVQYFPPLPHRLREKKIRRGHRKYGLIRLRLTHGLWPNDAPNRTA